MQILSGILKGRKIKFSPKIRPTQNKIRKAIFDCLGSFVKNSSVLELFAGSGAVGIEALSSGAKEVTFVDNDIHCLKLLELNLKSLDITSYKIYRNDSLKAVDSLAKRRAEFDIIFLDPPYRQDLAKKSLLKISVCDIVTFSSLVIFEHHHQEELPERKGSLMLFKEKRYGDKVLSFYRKETSNQFCISHIAQSL